MNNKQLTLKQNSIWNLSGSIIHALSQWLILIIIAKFGTSEMVGVFTLGLAITAPLVLLLRFHLRNAVTTDVLNEYTFNEYFTARSISTIIFIIVMLVLSLFYPVNYQTSLVIFILSIGKAFESISDIFQGYWQKHERLDLVAKSRILNACLSIIVFTLILGFTNNLIYGTISLVLVWLGVLLFYDYRMTKLYTNIKFIYDKRKQMLLLKLTLPLGLAQLLASLNANIPRYFIEYYYSLSLLGVFAALIYIITAGVNLIIAIEAAIIPRLSRWCQQGEVKRFKKLIYKINLTILLGGVIMSVIIYYYGDLLLTIIYTKEYAEYYFEFFMLFIAGIFMYVNKIMESALTATRKFIIQPYINGAILLLTIVISYILIPEYAILGISYTLIIIGLIQYAIRLVILEYICKQKLDCKEVGLK